MKPQNLLHVNYQFSGVPFIGWWQILLPPKINVIFFIYINPKLFL